MNNFKRRTATKHFLINFMLMLSFIMCLSVGATIIYAADSSEIYDEIYLDTTLPSTTAPAYEVVDGKVVLTSNQTDAESGIGSIEYGYKLEGEEDYTWQDSSDFSGLEYGTYDVVTRATDLAGNVQVSEPVSVEIENPTPGMLMKREDSTNVSGTGYVYYAIGAKRASQKLRDSSYLTYTSDSIKTIILLSDNTVPADAIASWDASYTYGDGKVMAWVKVNEKDTSVYDLYIGSNNGIIAPADSGYLFADYANCVEIRNLSILDTENVTGMSSMFAGCRGLTSLDVSKFDTRKVTDMGSMFWNCKELKSILLGDNFNKLTGSDMFSDCSKLTTIITTKSITLSRYAMTLGTSTGLSSLSDAILYVPNEESEVLYEKATNYSTVFASDKDADGDIYRIRPILELNGDKTITLLVGSTYTDEGALVAGMNINTLNNQIKGYTLTTTGLDDVDTRTAGNTATITYTLKYKDPYDENATAQTIMTAERTVTTIVGYYSDGTNLYDTLVDAFEGADNGDTIEVMQDVTDDTYAIVPTGKSIILDLKGNTITMTALMPIENNGMLEIKDSASAGGKLLNIASNNESFINNADNLITLSSLPEENEISEYETHELPTDVSNGSIVQNVSGTLITNKGIVTINENVFLQGYDIAIRNEANSILNMRGGTLTNNVSGTEATLYVEAGAIINIYDGIISSNGAGKAIINNGTITISNRTESEGQPQIINENGVSIINQENIGDTTAKLTITDAIIEGVVINRGVNKLSIANSTLQSENDIFLITTAGTVTIKDSTYTGKGLINTFDENAIVNLTNVTATATETVIANNYGTVNVGGVSVLTSTTGTAIETAGITNIKDEVEIKGVNGIYNIGTLTFGISGDTVNRLIKVNSSTTAINNEGVFNWYDGEITGTTEKTYIGNTPKLDASVSIMIETNVDRETQYVLLDTEAPVISNIITETDWVKNSQTLQVIAEDNTGVIGYAVTEDANTPSVDSGIWSIGNTFIVNQNKIYYIWAKDAAGNVGGRAFTAQWICQEIWDTTGQSGKDTRAVLELDGTLLFEVVDVATGKDYNSTGVIKDYAINTAPWSNDNRVIRIEVSEGITAIGEYGLSNATNVASISIPASVTSISESAFYRTNNYNNVSVSGSNTEFKAENLAIYTANKDTLYVYSNMNIADTFVMDSTVVTIGAGAFYGNDTLTEMRVSPNVLNVGLDAFEGVTDDVYYYTSSEGMKEYVEANPTEANFIPIDNVKPIIEKFEINNGEAASPEADVILTIDATDDVEVVKYFASATYYTPEQITSVADSEWMTYTGEESYKLAAPYGTKTVYVWVKDSSGNISDVVEDSIYYDAIGFDLYGQTEIVQYVDTTGKDYYEYVESIQGGHSEVENHTVHVTGLVNHKVVGTYTITYSIIIDNQEMIAKYRTVDVIENSWTGATGTTDDGFTFVIHTNGKYAKITGFTGTTTEVFEIPASVELNGVEYKVIDVGNTDTTKNILNIVTSYSDLTYDHTVEKIILPDTLIRVSDNAFANFDKLTILDIPNSIMSFGSRAFKDAGASNKIDTLRLPDNFRVLEKSALTQINVNNIDFGNTIRCLDTYSVSWITNNTNLVINIPESVEYISEATFRGSYIYDINVDEDNVSYRICDSNIALLTADGTTLIAYPTTSDFEEYRVQDSVKVIGNSAFTYATTIKAIDLANVTEIHPEAFENIQTMTTVTGTSNVGIIGSESFKDTPITEFEFSKNLSTVGDNAFQNTALSDVVIESKASIGEYAFADCENLEDIMFSTNLGIVTFANANAIPDAATIYVPFGMEAMYEGDSVYKTIPDYTNRIKPILKLIGDSSMEWLLNEPYTDEGVYALGVETNVAMTETKIPGFELIVEGGVNPGEAKRHTVTYIAKYNGVEVDRVERIIDIKDYEAPVINGVETDSSWVVDYQTFIVDATDNIAVTGYYISTSSDKPALDAEGWQVSNLVKAIDNGTWYIFARDGFGNVSEPYEVEATWVCSGVWDISKNSDRTVLGILSVDGTELYIKGIGETKDYEKSSAPWYLSNRIDITKIEVDEGVRYLGSYLLENMPRVETIELPASLERISDTTFALTNNFDSIELNENTRFVYENGTLYGDEFKTLYVHTNKFTNSYALPTTVTKICAGAFANNTTISSLDLSNVTSIGDKAFSGVLHFGNVYVSKKLENIGANVFEGTYGPIYYYSSCATMMEYVKTYGTETTFIMIDDVLPIVEKMTINDNAVSTDDRNVTLNIKITDDVAVSKILISELELTNLKADDSRWQDYNGETELAYKLSAENGEKTIYVWAMDTSNNISIPGVDTILLGVNDFAFETDDYVVQYVDKTGKNYYEYSEEFQGGYTITTEGITVEVDTNIDVTTVGEKEVVYSLFHNGLKVAEYIKTVYVIEDEWEDTIYTFRDYEYQKHISGKYAKITKYLGSDTSVDFPTNIRDENNESYLVIEIESLDENPVVPTSTRSVILPYCLISVGKNAFANCINLNNIEFMFNVMTIEENAFKNSGIQNLIIDNNTREIKRGAFDGTPISSVTLGVLTKSIEEDVFRNAITANEVILRNTIDNIGEGAFAGSIINNFETNAVSEDSKYVIYDSTYVVERNTSNLVAVAVGSVVGDVEIKEFSINRIGNGAFMNADSMTSISIPEGYNEIGKEAFRNTALRIIEVPGAVKEIPEYAFADCNNLSFAALHSVTEISVSAFENDNGLNSLVILTDKDSICTIDNASLLPIATNIYVVDSASYKASSDWNAVEERIFDILRLNGAEEVVVEAGDEYVEEGVYVIDEVLVSNGNHSILDSVRMEIMSDFNTQGLGEQEVRYTLYSETEARAEVIRIIKVQDTTPPTIEEVQTIDEAQAIRERFTVIATDNHRIAGYAITKDNNPPELDSDIWVDSNILYAYSNGLWYIWVKDEAGNISVQEVEAVHICRAEWDIGVIPGTVFGLITFDNEFVIEGEGAVKYFAEDEIPWIEYMNEIVAIEVREGVTLLREYTLGKLPNVETISLPSSLVSVETSTFAMTNNYDSIVFPNGTSIFTYEDRTLYSVDKDILYVHSNKNVTTDYTIDSAVEVIAEYAFANNQNIITINVTSNPTLLEGAFSNAKSLETINGQIGGTKISVYAFEGCNKLSRIELSETLETIGSYAFSDCNMIFEFNFKACENLTTFEHHAFANLYNIKTLRIPRIVTTITTDDTGTRNVFENLGGNFSENAIVYYYESCNVMMDYAANYADENVDFVLIDEVGPTIINLEVENIDGGTYAAGTYLEIVATLSEEFITTKGIIPVLSIAFGNGHASQLESIEINGNKIKYGYTITPDDLGKLTCVAFEGEVYDDQDNRTIFTEATFNEKEVFARSGVLVESDFDANKYFTTLAVAADYITIRGNLTLLLDEEAVEPAIFKENTLVNLDINGKTIMMNTNASNSLIINRGIMNIKDSGSGLLGISGDNGNVYVISNEGDLTVTGGVIRAQGFGDGIPYGIFNAIDAKTTVTGGSIEAVNLSGTGYAILNAGKLFVRGGTIAATTLEGTAYGIYNTGETVMTGGNIAVRLTSGNSGLTTGIYIQSGKVVMGADDGTISIEIPSIYSAKEGIRNVDGSLEFYDGVVEGALYKSVFSDDVKVVEGYALSRKPVGEREKAMLDFDVIKPSIELTNLTPEWRNSEVIIEARITDNESGLFSAKFEGTDIALVDDMIEIKVDENGIYKFVAVDLAGNVAEESIKIDNLDKVAPTFGEVKYESMAGQKEVILTAEVKDDLSGIYGFVLSKSNIEPTRWERLDNIKLETVLEISVTLNGVYYLYIIDDAGNSTRYGEEIDISIVDASAPKIEKVNIQDDDRGFANSTAVMIEVDAKDDTGLAEILISNTLLTNSQVNSSTDWVPYSDTVLWNLPTGDGEKTVYVWVKDRVGRVSSYASDTIKLLAQYVGNDGASNTSFKLLIKDANYDFNEQLTDAEIAIRVKDVAGNVVAETGFGQGISLKSAPTIYGPVQEGTEVMNGRYYTIIAENLTGNGTVFLVIKTNAEVDRAGNTIKSNTLNASEFEIATDVVVELGKPTISVTDTEIVVTDAEEHRVNALKVDGMTIELTAGRITMAELSSKYGITVESGTVLETIDKCGNTTVQVVQ